MELRHLRYFTAVVQWKGYREASRRLHVAQPAISRTVTDLEDEPGLKLFSRKKRVAELTPEAENPRLGRIPESRRWEPYTTETGNGSLGLPK